MNITMPALMSTNAVSPVLIGVKCGPPGAVGGARSPCTPRAAFASSGDAQEWGSGGESLRAERAAPCAIGGHPAPRGQRGAALPAQFTGGFFFAAFCFEVDFFAFVDFAGAFFAAGLGFVVAFFATAFFSGGLGGSGGGGGGGS